MALSSYVLDEKAEIIRTIQLSEFIIMPAFSYTSINRLETCVPELQDIFNEVVKEWDCSILCGYRTEKDQNRAFEEGVSKLKWPESEHNSFPSSAVDAAPYPIDWDDLGSFYMFAGYVMRVAREKGYRIRYGGDWDGDKKTADQKFNDLPHFEYLGKDS